MLVRVSPNFFASIRVRWRLSGRPTKSFDEDSRLLAARFVVCRARAFCSAALLARENKTKKVKRRSSQLAHNRKHGNTSDGGGARCNQSPPRQSFFHLANFVAHVFCALGPRARARARGRARATCLTPTDAAGRSLYALVRLANCRHESLGPPPSQTFALFSARTCFSRRRLSRP